jgi:hypothetical protein
LRTRASAGLIALALVAGGCGGDEGETEAAGEPVGGSVAALAQCQDWIEASEAERQATIEDIRLASAPQTEENATTSLSDEDAYELFESSCEPSYARSLELYKLYARANAFAPLRPED